VELILWRHADAEDGTPDSERKLTAKGVKQAARMAKWLRPRIPEDALILASPAKRAQQTARALNPDFRTVKEIGTSAALEDVLLAAGWPKGDRTVVVVGHQPTLGETAALLLTGAKEQWSLKKGAVVWIARRTGVADARTHLRAAISPDLL
jgi:phosphohistidine phosphatase